MSDSEQPPSQSLSDEIGLFAKLVPAQEHKQKLTTVNLLLKKSLDKELQKKFKAKQESRRSRSRSRDRQKKSSRANEYEKERYRANQNEQERQQIIILSDDEPAEQYDKFKALERGIYDPIASHEHDGMNSRERKKIDRLMERGMRHFRQGKVRDQLSFVVFNTIEAYFK